MQTANVVYNLDLLSIKRPGPVLVVGYGNPLKSLVKAAASFGVTPLISTSTDDKWRAFTFGGTAETASVGAKFDARLFGSEYAVLGAAEQCGARTLLLASNSNPSNLLAQECVRRDILLLQPVGDDKSLGVCRRVVPYGVANEELALAECRKSLTEVKWRRCAACGLYHDDREVVAAGYRCPECASLARLTSEERAAITFDVDSVEEWDANTPETNALDFPDFDGVIERARLKSGYDEGVLTGSAAIEGMKVAFGIMEPSFMMGSMGHVVGERLACMFERAANEGLPAVVFSSSGGARMQEGLISLMQMAKVSAAVQRHSEAGLLYLSVLVDPTTGGVTASFATLGDIILAEPGANIGFAGRRVIKDTIRQALPDDFQTAEFALQHGLIDAIVKREHMRSTIASILRLHGCMPEPSCHPNAPAASALPTSLPAVEPAGFADEAGGSGRAQSHAQATQQDTPVARAIGAVESALQSPSLDRIVSGIAGLAENVGQVAVEQATLASQWWRLRSQSQAAAPFAKPGSGKADAGKTNSQWESVQLARNVKRPTSSYYIESMFDDFIELHGDRAYADDGAIVAGIGRLGDLVVTVIAQEKGVGLKDRIARNFGCPQPEGYRKAMRLMDQAQKFGRPIVCLVDTQGAFCGKEAEERGIGNAIAESLAKMSALTVPVVSVVIGEGGSGGALALAVSNRVAMQENAVYSVLSPEGFASILWKDGSRAPEAAEVMKVGAQDALSLGIVEDVIVEGRGPSHENPDQAAAALWLYLEGTLMELIDKTPDELRRERYERFRKF